VTPPLGQGHCTITTVDGDEPYEALISQLAQIALAWFGLVARIAEIALGHDPKRADRRERPPVVPVQFVAISSVKNDLALETARELKTFQEHVPGIEVPVTSIAIAVTKVVVSVARAALVAIRSRPTPQFDPGHLDIADVIVAIPRIEVVEHDATPPSRALHADPSMVSNEAIMESDWSGINSRSVGFGSFWADSVRDTWPSRDSVWSCARRRQCSSRGSACACARPSGIDGACAQL
jgi:hypothetical protein